MGSIERLFVANDLDNGVDGNHKHVARHVKAHQGHLLLLLKRGVQRGLGRNFGRTARVGAPRGRARRFVARRATPGRSNGRDGFGGSDVFSGAGRRFTRGGQGQPGHGHALHRSQALQGRNVVDAEIFFQKCAFRRTDILSGRVVHGKILLLKIVHG